jgi:transcriptional regulator with XRE-family HTH domain
MTAAEIGHGALVAHYRRARNWTQEQLAAALQVDTRTVQRMERKAMIREVNRRRLLVAMLGIPAGLLGLAEEQQAAQRTTVTVNDDRMAFLEDELTTRREMYHTGGTLRAARGITTWCREVERLAAAARTTAWRERALTVLTLSYQLQGSILADDMLYQEAHRWHEQALRVAQDLGDRELIAAALARRGVTFVQEERAHDALRYLTAALETIRQAGLPGLRGYALQALSEAYAKSGQPQESWRAIGLAERILERYEDGQQEGERTQAKIDMATVTAQKGVNAVLLGEYERAITSIEKSLQSYDPTLVRARARLLAQKAEALSKLRLLDACVETAREALTLARSVGSTKTIARVAQLHDTLNRANGGTPSPHVAYLGALLSK